MKSIILDSSVFIASADKKDLFHNKTKDFIVRLNERIPDTQIVVPILIVLEVANILKRNTYEVRSIFEGGQIIDFNYELAEKMIPIFQNLKLKASDASIVACAKIYDADLISW